MADIPRAGFYRRAKQGFKIGASNDRMVPSTLSRLTRGDRAGAKVGYALSQRKVQGGIAAAAGTGAAAAAYGTGKKQGKKIQKSDSISAFGVDHG